MKILILAGGCGKRLWPLSTEKHPKQFMHLGDGESLLRKTVKRFSKHNKMDQVFIVTNQEYITFVIEDLKDIDPSFNQRILTEPCSRNTAAAITWAIRSLLLRQLVTDEEAILTVPIDHIFSEEDTAINMILHAEELLEPKTILAFGVKCTRVESGYGHLKKGEMFSQCYYEVKNFIEKPQASLARECLQEGGWLWNLGIFFFFIKTYLEELNKFSKILYDQCDPNIEGSEYFYKNLPSMSIDHAIMEKSTSLRVIELVDVVWIDIGSWHNLYELLQQSSYRKIHLGNSASKETLVLG